MTRLAEVLEGNALDLDLLDQRAFLALLGGAWTDQGEKVREIIGTTVADANRTGQGET
jgi:hypothetical protein